MFRASMHLGMKAKLNQRNAMNFQNSFENDWIRFEKAIYFDSLYVVHSMGEHSATDGEQAAAKAAELYRDDYRSGRYWTVVYSFLKHKIHEGNRSWLGGAPPFVSGMEDMSQASASQTPADSEDKYIPLWLFRLQRVLHLTHRLWVLWALYLPRNPGAPNEVNDFAPEFATRDGSIGRFAEIVLNGAQSTLNNLKMFGNDANASQRIEVSIPASIPGTLLERTNDSDRTIKARVPESIDDKQPFDVYWDEGSRTGVLARTVNDDSIKLIPDTGSGDPLPPGETAVKLMNPIKRVLSINQKKLQEITFKSEYRGTFVLVLIDEDTGKLIREVPIRTEDQQLITLNVDSSLFNEIGKTTHVYFSHADTELGETQRCKMSVTVLNKPEKYSPSHRRKLWIELCHTWKKIEFDKAAPEPGVESMIQRLVEDAREGTFDPQTIETEYPAWDDELVAAMNEHHVELDQAAKDNTEKYPQAQECFQRLSDQFKNNQRVEEYQQAAIAYQHLLRLDDPEIYPEVLEEYPFVPTDARKQLERWLSEIPVDSSTERPIADSLKDVLELPVLLPPPSQRKELDSKEAEKGPRQKDHDGRLINMDPEWQAAAADDQDWLRGAMRAELKSLGFAENSTLSVMLEWFIAGEVEVSAAPGSRFLTQLVKFDSLHTLRALLFQEKHAEAPVKITFDQQQQLVKRLEEWAKWEERNRRSYLTDVPRIDGNLNLEVPEGLHTDAAALCEAIEEANDWDEPENRPGSWDEIEPAAVQLALQHATFTLWMDELQEIMETVYKRHHGIRDKRPLV